jgi:hypothetical protein
MCKSFIAETDIYYIYGASAAAASISLSASEDNLENMPDTGTQSSYRNSGRCDQSRTLIIEGLGFKALNM